jgi:hypothetical protein
MKHAASEGKSFEAGIPPAEISRATTRALREKQSYFGSPIGDLTVLVIARYVMEPSYRCLSISFFKIRDGIHSRFFRRGKRRNGKWIIA